MAENILAFCDDIFQSTDNVDDRFNNDFNLYMI